MERPIIFTTESVKAILDDRKTMTRRVCKQANDWQQHYDHAWVKFNPKYNWWEFKGRSRFSDLIETLVLTCPYGQVGDRLWVRETWYWNCVNPITSEPLEDRKGFVSYRADGEFSEQFQNWQKDDKWRPSIFMPRWASRLTLEITEVRVERLQEITSDDARLEGVDFISSPINAFKLLWDSLNAKRGYGWETNPWVWVIKFDNIGVRVK